MPKSDYTSDVSIENRSNFQRIRKPVAWNFNNQTDQNWSDNEGKMNNWNRQSKTVRRDTSQ